MKKKEKLKKPINLSPNVRTNLPINGSEAGSVLGPLSHFGPFAGTGPLNSFTCKWTSYDYWSECNYFQCVDPWNNNRIDIAYCPDGWTIMREY